MERGMYTYLGTLGYFGLAHIHPPCADVHKTRGVPGGPFVQSVRKEHT